MREIVPNNGQLVRRAVAFISDHAGVGEIMVVGPSRAALDDLGHLACSRALAGVYRYTLRDLVYALSERAMYAGDWVPLHPVVGEAVAVSLAREAKLAYLRESAAFPGFARALGQTLEDLRLDRISPARLPEVGRSGSDLAILLEQWSDELATRGFADYSRRVELAIAEATQAPRPPTRALLLVDVDVRTSAERQLIKVLSDRVAAILDLAVDRRETTPTNALTSIQRYAATGDAAPPRIPDASAAFFSASSEALEFVEIARRVAASGVPFDQIAVLLRNPKRHVPLLQEAFNRAGIPLWLEGGLRRRDNSGRAFLTLLRCREERFLAARFAEYLSIARLPGEIGPTPATWERLLNESAVIAGHERWHSRLDAALDRALAEYKQSPSEWLSRYISIIESFREFALPIIDHLAGLPDRALWGDWLAALEELSAAALADPRTITRALDELAPVADLGPVSLTEVIAVLERLISDWSQEAVGQRYGKVFAAKIADARGMNFQHVFVPGLNEGLFPRTAREDPLLLDEQRLVLSLPGSRDDRELLDTALCTASDSIVFSWARLDLATGRERIPSFFVAEMVAAARGADEDLNAALTEARAQVSSKIGWSAPEQPSDSIDDSEYDLSSFREACKRKSDMAWFREVSSNAIRAIEARDRRWSARWTEADGLNADYDMQTALALKTWELGEHAYAPTSLNKFARCPYQFYLASIARLQPAARPKVFDRLDPVMRGHLYHRTLFLFFSSHDRTLDDVLAEVTDEAAEKLAPPILGVWSTEVAKLRADLNAWINCRDPEWEPMFIELAFGLRDLKECDPRSVPEAITIENGWRLCGSIDLVERHGDGRLRILDHKTGTPDKKDWGLCLGRGQVLQPVLYALALETLGHGVPGTAALSWATLRGGFRTDEIRIDHEARKKVSRVLEVINSYVHRGFLPAAPQADACKKCEYLSVCGPWEEVRTARKEPAELTMLTEIRGFK